MPVRREFPSDPSTSGNEWVHRSDGPQLSGGWQSSDAGESPNGADRVEPLWPGRVALGQLTILAGGTMSGKSFVSADLAARTTRGLHWPDARIDQADRDDGEIPPPRPHPARVLIVPGNPSRARRLRPRLAAAGADLDRIVLLPAGQGPVPVDQTPTSIDQTLASIEQALVRASDCKLLIFEPPPVGFASRGGDLDEASVALFQSLAELAARRLVAVLAVVGLRQDFAGPLPKRQLGALASCGVALSVWALLRDEASPELRYLVATRSPEADDRAAMAFRIRQSASCAPGTAPPIAAQVEWRAEGLATADGASRTAGGAAASRRAQRVDAIRWLKSLLRGGRMPVSEIQREASGAGYSWATIRRARQELPVGAHRVYDHHDGCWVWEMKAEAWLVGQRNAAPDDKPRPLPKIQVINLATMEVVDEISVEPVDRPAQGGPWPGQGAQLACENGRPADAERSPRDQDAQLAGQGAQLARENGRPAVAGGSPCDQGAQLVGQGAQLAGQGVQLARKNGRLARVGGSPCDQDPATKTRRVKRNEKKKMRRLVAIGLKR